MCSAVGSTQRFIKMGSNSSLLLYSLIEDILDLSKLEAGTFATSISSFCVVDVLDEVADVFEFQCMQKRLELNIDVDERLRDIDVASDRGRIKQVLLNLMSNALKFTFAGSISVSATLCDDRHVEFCVSDTGIGIKREHMRKLFTLFAMFDSNKHINPHGCGIGLTVSKKYVEKLGGTIWVESEPDKYTRVVFRVPHNCRAAESDNQRVESDSNEEELLFSSCINSENGENVHNVYNANQIYASKHILNN